MSACSRRSVPAIGRRQHRRRRSCGRRTGHGLSPAIGKDMFNSRASNARIPRYGRSLEDRLSLGTIPEPNSGCWLWIGLRNPDGYGRFFIKKRGMSAHRIAWELSEGQAVPAGMYVCHRCDMPSCVNPDHLFVGTPLQNMLDASLKGRIRVRGTLMTATHCERGHERTTENTANSAGERHCRICRRSAQKRHYAKMRLRIIPGAQEEVVRGPKRSASGHGAGNGPAGQPREEA